MSSDTITYIRTKEEEQTFKNMQDLLSDLYYKQIVESHTDVIEKGTNQKIADIMWRFKKHHISKHEMFTELESLRSGYKVTDVIIKDALVEARSNFCKVKKKI